MISFSTWSLSSCHICRYIICFIISSIIWLTIICSSSQIIISCCTPIVWTICYFTKYCSIKIILWSIICSIYSFICCHIFISWECFTSIWVQTWQKSMIISPLIMFSIFSTMSFHTRLIQSLSSAITICLIFKCISKIFSCPTIICIIYTSYSWLCSSFIFILHSNTPFSVTCWITYWNCTIYFMDIATRCTCYSEH